MVEPVNRRKVLVTGALGFVGSALCRELLLRDGLDIVSLDDESRGSKNNIAGLDVQCINCDICERADVKEAIRQIDPSIVIHLAAMHFIPDCNRNPSKCLYVNVVGTENVLGACRKSNVKRVVLTSSMAVYPIKDEANYEDDPAMPYDVYGESKLANEFQARRFQSETGIDTIVVRLTNVYGPRETNPHVIPEIMEQIKSGNMEIKLGNIDPLRDFIYTSDAARGFTSLALDSLPPGFHLVNLGSGKEYSIKEIIQIISKILRSPVLPLRDESRYREFERMHLLTDITRINKLTGWSPSVDLYKGLEDTCKWYGLNC